MSAIARKQSPTSTRPSHYDRPLIKPDPYSYYAFIKRAFWYLDEDEARSHQSARPREELLNDLWANADVPLIKVMGAPAELFSDPPKPYVAMLREAMVNAALAEIERQAPQWSERDRVGRVVVAIQLAHDVLKPSKAEQLLNRGARSRGPKSSGRLTRDSIASAWKTWRAGRWDWKRIHLDCWAVQSLAFLEKQAAQDQRFAHLRGEQLADRIEECVGLARVADKAFLRIHPEYAAA